MVTPRFKTERLTFADTGDWWEIRTTLTVALDREFSDIALQSQSLLQLSDPSNTSSEVVKSLAARMDQLMLKCTAAWSYGAVIEAILHNSIPVHHYQQVGDRMVSLYSPLMLKRLETLLNASSSLLNPGQSLGTDSPSQPNLP